MGRPLRAVADGLVYHAINRGNNRAAVFDDAEGYGLFLRSLRQTKERYPFKLFGYCLMTNHFHLVLQPEAGQSTNGTRRTTLPKSGPLERFKVAKNWQCCQPDARTN